MSFLKSWTEKVMRGLLKRKPKTIPMPELRKLKKRGYSVQCGLCEHRIPVTRKEAVLGIQGTCGCHGTFRHAFAKVKRDRQHKKQLKLIRRKLKQARR